MKRKQLTAMMLSVILAAGSISGPVFAAEAEATGTTAVSDMEESVEQISEDALTTTENNLDADTAEAVEASTEEIEEEPIAESLEEPAEAAEEEAAVEEIAVDNDEEAQIEVEENEAESLEKPEEAVAEDLDSEAPAAPAVIPEETIEQSEITEMPEAESVSLEAMMDGASEIVDSGTCGENLAWTLDGEGTLTISGTGNMTSSPWKNKHSSEISNVVIEDGVPNITSFAFQDCSVLTNISIPESVTSIGASAFNGCNSLLSVVIPEGVTSIEGATFFLCRSLESVTIPDSVTEIGNGAFDYCGNLTNITLPEGVVVIEAGAFNGCSSLESITIPAGITRIEDSVFSECSSLKSVIIPEGVTSIGTSFDWCSSLEKIIIPENVTAIGRDAFMYCSSLKEITIPKGVTSIESGTFYGCSKLESITLPENITSIGKEAFKDCTSLASLTLPASVTSIGEYAFHHCESLTDFVIPEEITSIEGSTFSYCENLERITIPRSVKSIGDLAFYACLSLTDIIYGGSEDEWKEIVIGTDNSFYLDGATLHYAVNYISIADAEVTNITDMTYTGVEIEQTPVVKVGDTVLTAGTDYTISYSDNIKAGTATITFEGIGNYVDTTTTTFTINPASISTATVSGLAAQVYTGAALTQTPVVTLGSISLLAGSDYTVSYKNNVNAGTASVVFTGQGNYKDTIEKTFAITPKTITPTITLSQTSFTYKGSVQKPAVSVKAGGTTLPSTDYTVTWPSGCTNAGTYTISIALKRNYSGTGTVRFVINKAANKITASNFTRSYSAKTQTITLGAKATGGTLTYKSSNTKVKVTKAGKVTLPAKFTGTVKITITAGNSNYNTVTKAITITVPSKTALSKVTSPSVGKMKVTWKKNTKVTGYQIQYSLNSNFASPKTTTITKNSTVSKTIGSLKKGKKYYVRIRSYKTVSGKKYYSAWSSKKTVTIKK